MLFKIAKRSELNQKKATELVAIWIASPHKLWLKLNYQMFFAFKVSQGPLSPNSKQSKSNKEQPTRFVIAFYHTSMSTGL